MSEVVYLIDFVMFTLPDYTVNTLLMITVSSCAHYTRDKFILVKPSLEIISSKKCHYLKDLRCYVETYIQSHNICTCRLTRFISRDMFTPSVDLIMIS
jgi:hypothetical protein